MLSRNSNHTFAQIPKADVQRSVFDRSHGHKTTFDEGYLIPFYCDEALPGDTFKANVSIFARLSTPIVPIMDNMYLDTFYFAVPLRLVWDHFKAFMGEQEPNTVNGVYTPTEYFTPTLDSYTVTEGSLSDHLGLPIGYNQNSKITSLYHRCYNLIWNQWFRDENLQASVAVPMGDGPDQDYNFTLLKRGKRHDYFTSALLWPQKGVAINLPLGSSAPVVGTGMAIGLDTFNATGRGLTTWQTGGTGYVGLGISAAAYGSAAQSAQTAASTTGIDARAVGLTQDATKSGLIADLSKATAPTVNSLRQAFQLQKLLERDARAGTRYTEIVRSHFQVVSPDSRQQRAEYIGGSSTRMNINPVQQTSASPTSPDKTHTPQGNLAAFGLAHDDRGGFTKSFTEHSIIIGLVCARAELSYQYGVPRKFSRRTKYDFYWPALANIGEQEILNKEIYAQNNADDEKVFGYQERWAEYRYFPSEITGKFRSSATTSLDVWHLAEKYTALPTLGSTFISLPSGSTSPFARSVAITTEPRFIFDSQINLSCARAMPVYSVPGLIDHF